MDWIRSHRDLALRLSERSHKIFAEKFSYEHLLKPLEEFHRSGQKIAKSGSPSMSTEEWMQLFLRLRKRSACYVKQAIKGRIKKVLSSTDSYA
jgi:hypothetical protein